MVVLCIHYTLRRAGSQAALACAHAEPSTLDIVRLAVEHLTTALADLALLLVVDLAVGNAGHTVSTVVPRPVAHKQILWAVVRLDFINVVNSLPLLQQTVDGLHDQNMFQNPTIVGTRMF